MNQGWVYRERFSQTEARWTLLNYYTRRYQHSSSEEWRERIVSGQILVDGQPATPQTLLQEGQYLTYHRPPWQEPDVPSFATLYEDTDLLIVGKPSGLPVLPGGGFLENTLLWQLQQQYPTGTPYPIHRLGRGTSGLMLLAKTAEARANLSRQMRDRQISKVYRALVGQSDLSEHFTIAQPIGKIPHPVLGYIYGATPDGRSAYSEGRVIRRTPETTLLAVKIVTGRPHQIRIHLATIGYPLLGDPLYEIGGIPQWTTEGKIPVPGDGGYYLHAYHLSFVHPSTGQLMSVCCPPSQEFGNSVLL